MIQKFLKSIEDPKRPLLGPNYWFIKKVGLILPKNRIGKCIYVFIHEIATFFVLTQYMELYVIRDNIRLVLTNLTLSMLSIVCVAKSNSFLYWQKDWKQVFDFVTLADRYERDTRDPTKGRILDAYTRYSRRVTYAYWVLVVMTAVVVDITPIMSYTFSASLRERIRNDEEKFPHIFSSWVPWDKYSLPGSAFTVLWHIFICNYGAVTIAGYDTTVIVTMVFFGGALEMLRERCRMMWIKCGKSVTEEEAARIVMEIHTVHVLLMKYTKLFNSMLSPVMFIYVVICSLMLCASAYQLSTSTSTAETLLTAEYLLFGVAQLFMFCWHSNTVMYQSEDVYLGPCESEWYEVTGATRAAARSTLLLAGQLSAPVVFTAGPFTSLTVANFINILKGAYSYYTLVKN